MVGCKVPEKRNLLPEAIFGFRLLDGKVDAEEDDEDADEEGLRICRGLKKWGAKLGLLVDGWYFGLRGPLSCWTAGKSSIFKINID